MKMRQANMKKAHPRILLTGFEPFGGIPVNPTEKIVRMLETEALEKGIKGLDVRVLPVTADASDIVNELLTNEYDFVVHLGLHGKIDDLALERVAINMDDYRIPDNEGNQVRDRPIDPEGENAYFVTLPVREFQEVLRIQKVPCHLSYTAGTYLCNHLLYTTLHFLAQYDPGTKAGFIHVPSEEKMDFEKMLKGVRAILESLGVNFSD